MQEVLTNQQSSLRDVLTILFKRKKVIVLFFCITVGLITFVTFVSKPIYEARTQILVKVGRQNIYTPPNNFSGEVVNFNRKDQINTEIALLRNKAILRIVLKELEKENVSGEDDRGLLYPILKLLRKSNEQNSLEKSVRKFQKSLYISEVKDSDVISIGVRGKNPEFTAKAVNTLVAIYLQKHLELNRNNQTHLFFEEQAGGMKHELLEAENELEIFREQYSITSIEDQQNLLLQQISDLQVDFNRTLSGEDEIQNRILELNRQLEETPQHIPQKEEADYNSVLISKMEATLMELELEEKELLSKYPTQNRLVLNVQGKIAILNNKLSKQEARRYERSSVGLNTTYQGIKEELLKNKAEIKATQAKRKIQNKQIAEYQAALGKLNQLQTKMNQLQQHVKLTRHNYELYLAKYEEYRIANAIDKKSSNVLWLDKAAVPYKPVSPKVLLNIVLAIILGGVGSIALAFLVEYLDDTVDSPEELRRALNLPVLASVPNMGNTVNKEWRIEVTPYIFWL